MRTRGPIDMGEPRDMRRVEVLERRPADALRNCVNPVPSAAFLDSAGAESGPQYSEAAFDSSVALPWPPKTRSELPAGGVCLRSAAARRRPFCCAQVAHGNRDVIGACP